MNRASRSTDAAQPVFVGDVQGCWTELAELLDRLDARYGDDYSLHIAGDLINRGPRNLQALERVRRQVDDGRCAFVLGNHEVSFLRVAYGLRAIAELDSFGDVLDSDSREDWIQWLRARSLVECGEIAGQRYAMVHASAAPTWSRDTLAARARRVEKRLAKSDDSARALLAFEGGPPELERERDDLGRMTRCRSVKGEAWSSEEPGDGREAWHAAWSRKGHDYGIVYGHWARQRLHVAPMLRGLDTGCVHHGRGEDGFLTAWLPRLDTAPFDVPDKGFLQIRAHQQYYKR